MKKGVFCLLIALLLCFTVAQAVNASDDVDIDIPIGCEDHSYGSWSSNGNGTHSRSCPTCYDRQTQTCTLDNGTVTKPATCKEEGQKVRTCTVCRGTKTETISKTNHSRGNSWQTDKDHHWRLCTVCNIALEKGSHQIVSGNNGSYCSVCNRVMETQPTHVHNYASAWTTNKTGHWHTCSGCTEKSSYAVHSYTNACDPKCDICGYTRTVTHRPESKWSTDKNSHWKLCDLCGQKCEKAAHTPGKAATTTTAQLCTVCSFELAPVIAEEETQPTTAETTEAEETTEAVGTTEAVESTEAVETTEAEETTGQTEPTPEEEAPSVEESPEAFNGLWLFIAFTLSVSAIIAIVVISLRNRW